MEIDKDLTAGFRFVFDIKISFGIENQGFGFVKSGQIEIVIDKIEEILVAGKVFLPEGEQDRVFFSMQGKGWNIGFAGYSGNHQSSLWIGFGAHGIFQRIGARDQTGGSIGSVFFAETEGVIKAHEDKNLERK